MTLTFLRTGKFYILGIKLKDGAMAFSIM
jgi:hypothetical protein